MVTAARVCVVPAVRFSSRLQLATSFIPQTSSASRNGRRGGGQNGGSAAAAGAGPPPALTADVRVVIRRQHFPAVAGPLGTRRVVAAQKVAEDIALRRRPTRTLRGADRVERALKEEVLPLVAHPSDRAAVAAASREICAHVAAACADPRVATSGVRVLALVDTFACPVVLRPRLRLPACKPMMWSSVAVKINAFARAPEEPSRGLESQIGLAEDAAKKEQPRPIGVIGNGPPEPVEERFKGRLPW